MEGRRRHNTISSSSSSNNNYSSSREDTRNANGRTIPNHLFRMASMARIAADTMGLRCPA